MTSSTLTSSKLPILIPHSKFCGTSLTSSLNRLRASIPSLVDFASLANQAHLGGALDRALGDETAGDGPDLGDLEDLAHDGTAQVNFLDLRYEHPLDGLFDVVGDLVDDVVTADLDLLFLGERDGTVFGSDAEADHDGLRSVGQDDVALGDPADRL